MLDIADYRQFPLAAPLFPRRHPATNACRSRAIAAARLQLL
ncbi:hypothetical protein NB311A_05615 [Nitrobacter sp. Nb-311A]|nr:hypothetical protein NB311A_05615 [Nitrobacter sp. Nb-311A]